MSSDRFTGIAGHDAAKQILEQALAAPHHAYLILGAEGLGARLLAERFVRALAEVDDTRSLQSHPDVAVLARPIANEEEGIKTSSVISVEAVRELRARLSSRPVLAPRRVAFLPEADRLNDEGANALLKCLEEPPAGAVFVMAARDASRLPATMLSRSITLTLGPVSSRVIEAWLEERNVAAAERHEAVRHAAGRPGYALRWVEDTDERVKAADAARQVDAALSASDAGTAMAAFSEGARAVESSDDPRAAWDAHLDSLMRALRDHLAQKPRESLALGHALAEARRANGGPVSPRIWMEISLLRSFASGPKFPQHISSIV